MNDKFNSGSLSRDKLNPEEVFATLGNKHRMGIIRELDKRQSVNARTPDDPVPYSELLAATDIQDKGQFNYHLGKLTDIFVEKRTEGYLLTHAGREVVRAVKAGSFTARPDTIPIPVESVTCPYCGSKGLWFGYEGGVLFFGCNDCEGMAPDDPNEEISGIVQAGRFPASGLVDRTPEEIYHLGPIWGNFVHRLLSEGLCPSCAGNVEATVDVCSNHPEEGVCETCGERYAGGVSYTCAVCGYGEAMPLWGRALVHEEMFRFAYNRGVNLNRPSASDLKMTRDIEEEVLSTDPPRVRYSFTIEGDTLTMTIDDSLTMTDVTET
ncbi:MAG: helix-turn-helix domain-containing protein [Halobacteria archaeon]|nr:helix-turn-helix domain-containing protein [Halobacteria archaeon]